MNRKQYSLVLVLALVAGLASGVASSWFFSNQPVFAKEATKRAEEIFPEAQVIMAKEIMLLDLDRKPRIRLMVDKSGLRLQIGLMSLTSIGVEWPTILLIDKKGVNRTILTLDPIGRPHLTLKDDKDNTRAILGSTSLKHTQTVIGGKRPPSSLVLFNERGEVIWKAP